jgi:glyoxylase-like metal-dependent hydrolase (beta-lactamase superfamily II)
MSGENKVIERIKITEYISYIKASDNPLSADVVLVEGLEYLYIFDVGNNEQVAEYINSLPKKKRVILSHFHTDHIGNIGRVAWETVFFGANTEKYFQHYITDYAAMRFAQLSGAFSAALGVDTSAGSFPKFVIVFDTVKIQDGVSLEIYHVPNSHAKGSLLLQVNDEYLFVGDSLYSKVENDTYVYNAQLLKDEIELLKKLPGTKVFSSHEARPVKYKAGVVRFLEQIYVKREKNDAYIRVGKN